MYCNSINVLIVFTLDFVSIHLDIIKLERK